MQVQVLGNAGGETPHHLPTCLLIDETLAIDAGSLCRALPIAAQARIDHVLIGHSHMDHVKDLALLAENLLGRRDRPLDVHAGPDTCRALSEHLFNNVIWPDFTMLPTRRRPVLRLRPHAAGRKFKVGAFTVRFLKVNHPVESMGMLVSDVSGTMLYSSDTGPTNELWRQADRQPDLRAAFVETSLPNAMQQLAEQVGHLTPYSLARELTKMANKQLPVFLYHLKPSYHSELLREIRALRDPRLQPIVQGELIEF